MADKKKLLNLRYVNACAGLGWNISMDQKSGSITLRKYTTAGEDHVSETDSNNFVQGVCLTSNVRDDVDQVIIWVQAKRRDDHSTPSIRDLVEDTESVKEMLGALADTLESLI